MECYLGVDPSLTGCAVAAIDSKGTFIESQRFNNKLRGVERLIFIREKVYQFICAYNVQLIGIEGYARGARNRQEEAGELGGLLRIIFYERNIPWIDIAPSQLKKFATGKGDTQKDHVLLAIYKKWGIEFQTNDEADAFVAAQVARAMNLLKHDDLQKYEIEVLKKLGKGA